MKEVIGDWLRRRFSDPQAVILAILLVAGFATVVVAGEMLAPLLASIVIAYLLEGPIGKLERMGAPRLLVVVLVLMLFMVFLSVLFFGLLPTIWQQMADLFQELPAYISRGQQALMELPARYPFISEAQLKELITMIRTELGGLGQHLLSLSVSSLTGGITLLIYLILVPVLVFFLLKDKEHILEWIKGYLPRQRTLLTEVWEELDHQLGNYVRGKFWEIVIVAAASYLLFTVMGLKYAALLAMLVGFSVLVPYIGAAVVTIPVAVVGYFQWGLDSQFAWLMIAYAILQALDGNVLVPLLFSGVVNLHPVAIIAAVLFFGGIWGFWGVFFAIPLATLVSAVLRAWPTHGEEEGGPQDSVKKPASTTSRGKPCNRPSS